VRPLLALSGVELSLRVASPPDAEEMALHVADAALIACPETRASLPRPLSVARAHHAARDGSQLDEAQVVSLRDGAALGRFEPPVGRYCALEVIVTPAEALDGWTLRARGAGPDGARWAADGYAIGRWRLPLEAPLEIDADAPPAALDLVVDPAAALASVDTESAVEDLGLDLLLAIERGAVAVGRRP